MSELAKKQRYGAIDGLRAFSAIGIVLMHVRSVYGYKLPGFVYEQLIPSFTNLVFLFMIVSGFSVCCGYYEKAASNQISWGDFYKKRFAKVWPFFAFLSIVDLVLSPSVNSLYEVFANLTLCFGLLPNANISVIGVGWFLGVVFVFYMLFPFFCWLLSDKRRAWLAFAVALIFNLLCTVYFEAKRSNFIYCAVYFVAGGLIYIYKEPIGRFVNKWRLLLLPAIAAAAAGYFLIGAYTPIMIVLYSLILIYTLGWQGKYRILDNRFTRFIGGISMEIYLCHMVSYRAMEKLGLVKQWLPSKGLNYVLFAVATLVGAVVLSLVTNWVLKQAGLLLRRITRNK